MSENVNIDYNNILNHIDLAILSDKKKWIVDRNRNLNAVVGDIKKSEDTYKILLVDESIEWCDFWAKTENRGIVLSYFRNKYKNK